MKRISKFLLLFIFACTAVDARSSVTDIRAEMEFLTDPSLAGRGFGSGGSQMTAFYLLRQFRSAGLRTTVQSFRSGNAAGHNVVGVTPGWFRRYIVIGAYFDGLGERDGVVYPGADSNASGVAALLSLVRSLPDMCRGDVGIVFVAFDGHNADLSGSREFLARYRLEYEMSMMVNLDILGSTLVPVRKDRPDYIIALGASPYRLQLERANRGLGMDISYDYYGSRNFTDLFYRKISDQRWFLDAGIPSVMFTSGITMNTNKVTDTLDSLDLSVLDRRISLIGDWIISML